MVIFRLVQFLSQVSSYSTINKMTPANLAIVFAPNLLQPPPSVMKEGMNAILEDQSYSNKLMEVLIANFKTLFEVC